MQVGKKKMATFFFLPVIFYYAFHRLSVFMFLIILLQPRGNDAATHHDADRPNRGP